MLDKRKIEAEILKEVYLTLKESHGEEVAKKTIAGNLCDARPSSRHAPSPRRAGQHVLKAFQDVMPLWTKGGALENRGQGPAPRTYAFNVVRCRYGGTYKAIGLGEIGAPAVVQPRRRVLRGLRSKLWLERTQTIMQGASHCDFRVHVQVGSPVSGTTTTIQAASFPSTSPQIQSSPAIIADAPRRGVT